MKKMRTKKFAGRDLFRSGWSLLIDLGSTTNNHRVFLAYRPRQRAPRSFALVVHDQGQGVQWWERELRPATRQHLRRALGRMCASGLVGELGEDIAKQCGARVTSYALKPRDNGLDGITQTRLYSVVG